MSNGNSIPAVIHFCWIGSHLPWAYALAVASAAEQSGIPEILLHHSDDLRRDPPLRFLERYAAVRLQRIEAERDLALAGEALALGDQLVNLVRKLDRPVAKADLLRAALLYLHGGIYLDLDTVTTRSLLPLLHGGAFLGSEYILWPKSVRRSRSPLVWSRALGLDLLRKLARRHPEGWRHFRRIAPLYHRGLNNAVMGAPARAPLFAACLTAMAGMSAGEANAPFALGPDLLEAVVPALDPALRPRIEPPEVFYPLPPEVSEHWFRSRSRPVLSDVLPASTRVVHWYASVRSRARLAEMDPAYVRAHRSKQFYSALLHAMVPAIRGPGDAAGRAAARASHRAQRSG